MRASGELTVEMDDRLNATQAALAALFTEPGSGRERPAVGEGECDRALEQIARGQAIKVLADLILTSATAGAACNTHAPTLSALGRGCKAMEPMAGCWFLAPPPARLDPAGTQQEIPSRSALGITLG
jgi:hypothetical protein